MQQLLDLLPTGKRKDKLNKDLLNIKLGKSNKLLQICIEQININIMRVTYRGIILEVDGALHEGSKGDWNELSYGDEWETYSIMVEDINIIDLLSESQIGEIEEMILDKLN